MTRFPISFFQSLACLMLISCGFGTMAQTSFSASVSAEKIGVKDQVQVEYNIQNAQNLRTISRPDFKDFNVLGGPYQRQSSNVSISGNTMVQSESYTHTYILQPKHTGTCTIPAAIAKDVDGHQFQSNSGTIQVVDGSVAPAQKQRSARDPFDDPFDSDPFAALMQQQRQMMQNMMQRRMPQQAQPRQQQDAPPAVTKMADVYKNLFIKVDVDKTKAYVGEQITASYKLYARIPMNVGISKLPSLNGFWTQDFDMPDKGAIKPVEETIDGKKYQVFTLKKSALFPQQTGTLTLDPAQAEGNARIMQQVRQRNPFGDDPFFNAFGSLMMSDPYFNDDAFGGMGYKDVPVSLKSTPVKINVMPLPENGKPESFGGAVGQFSIKSRVDKNKLTTDDALTYTLIISGSGNFKLITAPSLNLPNGLSTYDPQVIDTITGRTNTIAGSKIITYTISANTPGNFSIPAVPFSFYNSATHSYTTLTTQPVNISVDKGKHYTPPVAIQKGMTDIHPNVTAPLKTTASISKPLVYSVGYWSLYAVPLFAFIGLMVWRRKDEELNSDVVKLKNKRANKIALKRLQTAGALLKKQSVQPFYEETSRAIWLYLSDKLNIPLSELNKENAANILMHRNIDESLLQQTERVINDCETALYMPGNASGEMQHTYAKAVDTISKLEEKL